MLKAWPAFAAAAWLLVPAPTRASAIDLHVHLLMDASLPGIFRGHPSAEPIPVSERRGRFSNQVSLRDLEAADVRLVAAALYAPAVLSSLQGGYAATLLRQIEKVERWAARDPRLSIVRDADEAEAVLKSKEWRLGVILAAEGAGGADTTERLDRLWDRGLRILTIAHFVDTRWAGAAAVRYWPRPSCVPGGKDPGRRNALGLTAAGKGLADYAVAKGLLLDLTHSSDKAALDLASRHPDLPLLFTHQAARELTPCERTISPELLRELRRSRGMVGVTLASNYVGADLPSFLRHAAALAAGAGPEAVAIGSDYNGLIGRVGGAGDSSGYAAVLKELDGAGIPAGRSAQAFVGFWRRAEAYAVSARSVNAARNKTPNP